jgi:hypothetical protein
LSSILFYFFVLRNSTPHVEKEVEERIEETEEEEEKKGETEDRPMTDMEPENDKAICENGEEGKTELSAGKKAQ